MWPDNAIYFYTLSTFLHFPYFKEDLQKEIILYQFKKIREKYKVKIDSYSIAVNHFHLKFYLESGRLMKQILQVLRGGTAHEYKKKFSALMKYKEMWQSRRIYTIASPEMSRMVNGYVIGNLLKHKEVSTFEELKNNRFSSYWYYAKKYGDKEMQKLVRAVIDINESNKGEIDLGNLVKIKSLTQTKVCETLTSAFACGLRRTRKSGRRLRKYYAKIFQYFNQKKRRI